MRESEVVGPGHRRRGLLVSSERVALAATRAANFLAGFHLIRRLVANIALAVSREGDPCARDRVAARAIGSLLSADVSGVRLVRELSSKSLPLREGHDLRLDRLDALVTIGADAELRRSEFLYVAGYARAMAGHHRFDCIGSSNMAAIALDLIVPRGGMDEFACVGLSGRGRLSRGAG